MRTSVVDYVDPRAGLNARLRLRLRFVTAMSRTLPDAPAELMVDFRDYWREQRPNELPRTNNKVDAIKPGTMLKRHFMPMRQFRRLLRSAIGIIVSGD